MNRIIPAATSLAYIILFAMMAALSTLLVWVVMTLPGQEPLAIDALDYWAMVSGLSGPLIIMLFLYHYTQNVERVKRRMLRLTCAVGVALVLLIELVYLVVLGVLNMAYSGVQM